MVKNSMVFEFEDLVEIMRKKGFSDEEIRVVEKLIEKLSSESTYPTKVIKEEVKIRYSSNGTPLYAKKEVYSRERCYKIYFPLAILVEDDDE